MMKLRHGSLFSGAGGFDLAAHWLGWENVFHCEINPFGQRVLHHYWPDAETFTDIIKSDFTHYADRIDVLTGGFPCQDASRAHTNGKGQQGLSGKRTGLFFEMLRAISEVRPRFIVAENVSDILTVNRGRDFTTILTELARLGYNAEWRVCRASEVGAPHHRARMYLVAYPDSFRLQKGQTFLSNVHAQASQIPWHFAGTPVQTFRGGAWSSEPPILCVDDGLPPGMAGYTAGQLRGLQLQAYGNSIVPQIAYNIFQAIEQVNATIAK